MKYLLILSGVLCLSLSLLPTCAPAPEPEPEAAPEPVFDQAAEEAAIREVTEQRLAVWNAKDVTAYLPFLDENCRNAFNGNPCAGELRETGVFPETTKNAQIRILEQRDVQFISPDVAIYRYTTEDSGFLDADGEPQPTTKNEAARVFVKKDAKWLVAVGGIARPTEE